MTSTTTNNLVVNGDCETGPIATDFTTPVTPAGWTILSGSFTNEAYSIGGDDDLNANDSALVQGGNGYFAGGPNSAFSSAVQVIDVSGYHARIDTGHVTFHANGDFGGFGDQDDTMSLLVTFLAGDDLTILGTATIGGVTAAQRGNETLLTDLHAADSVPVGTRFIQVELDATRNAAGAYNDGYADNISLTLTGANLPGGFLLVDGSHNFSGESISKVSGISFHTFGIATARFTAEQFRASGIQPDGTIIGDDQANTSPGTSNTVIVDIGHSHNFDASALTFEHWSATDDHFRINGNNGDDTILGPNAADEIYGGGGRDTIITANFYALPGALHVIDAGAGDDTIVANGILGPYDQIDGGDGFDQLTLVGEYSAGVTFGANTIKNVEYVVLEEFLNGNFNITLANGNAAAGQTLIVDGHFLVNISATINGAKEKDASLQLYGGLQSDTLTGGAHGNLLEGYGNADTLKGGAGDDAFDYSNVGDSTGVLYDHVIGFDTRHDHFDFLPLDLGFGTVDSPVSDGKLRANHFDADLKRAVRPADLHKHDAVVFTASAGDLNHHTFLIVDANGHAGYQAGQDIVIELVNATHLAGFDADNIIG